MRTRIYTLADPRDGIVRYVGKTRSPLRKRLSGHCSVARQKLDGSHRSCWIRSLQSEGVEPVIVLLEEVDGPEWEERERHWIATLPFLTNAAPGGDSGEISPEARAKATATRRKSFEAGRWTAPKLKPAHRAALAQGCRDYWRDQREAGTMHHDRPGWRAKQRAGHSFPVQWGERRFSSLRDMAAVLGVPRSSLGYRLTVGTYKGETLARVAA